MCVSQKVGGEKWTQGSENKAAQRTVCWVSDRRERTGQGHNYTSTSTSDN